MKKRRVIIAVVVTVIVLGGLGIGAKALSAVSAYKKQVADIKISNVNLSKIADGTYTGGCDVGMVSAQVKVTMKNHKILAIDLVKHNNGRGAPAEVIPGKVVEAQSFDVDVVSGATCSSKVILKAIENALNSATVEK